MTCLLIDEPTNHLDIESLEVLQVFTRRRFERCTVIVEGSEAIGRWAQDHSLPMDPTQVSQEVMTAAIAPL